jgi:hypothetical protein
VDASGRESVVYEITAAAFAAAESGGESSL